MNKDGMRLHSKNHDNAKCKYYPKTYQSKRTLTQHVKTCHQEEDPLNQALYEDENGPENN